MPLPDEYLEYLEKNTTALERFGDSFTTVDERVNYVVKQLKRLDLEVVEDKVQRLSAAVDTMVSVLKEGAAMIGETTQLRFQETLAALTGGRFVQNCPWDAINTSIAFHFPPGCNALVDVAVGIRNKRIYPLEGFIALDATTPVFNVYEMMDAHDEIWVEIRNTDGVWPHTITVIITLQRRFQ